MHQPNPRRTPVDAFGRKVVIGQRYSYGDPTAGWRREGEAVAFDGRGFGFDYVLVRLTAGAPPAPVPTLTLKAQPLT